MILIGCGLVLTTISVSNLTINEIGKSVLIGLVLVIIGISVISKSLVGTLLYMTFFIVLIVNRFTEVIGAHEQNLFDSKFGLLMVCMFGWFQIFYHYKNFTEQGASLDG